jgi:hypothetical protein
MYRNAAARSVFRAISSSNASVARSTLGNQMFTAQLTSSARAIRPTVKPSFALAAHKPVTTALVRYASSSAKVSDYKTHSDEERVQWLTNPFVG